MSIPLFALGQPSKRTGLGGYSMKTTIVGGVGGLIAILLMMASMIKAAIFVFIVALIVLGVVNMRFSGRSLATALQMRAQHMKSRFDGQDVYLAGRLSRVPGGTYRLPGMLARTEMLESVDSLGKPFGVVFERPRRMATVLIDCQLSGQTALTQEERNDQTANWGRWLSGLSMSGDVVSMQFVVANKPGSGALVDGEVRANVSPDAPWIARQVLSEAAAELSNGTPEIEAHIALTVSVRKHGDDEEFLDNLATRLPAWYEGLQWAGILGTPMTASDITARVHARFCPSTEADFELLGVQGVEHGMTWDDAGPSIAIAKTDEYVHEQARSVSWEMEQAPRSTFEDHILEGLIAAHGRIPRKRVCLVYMPFDAGKGASKVEAEHRDALVAANSSKKIRSAAAEMRLEHTEAARRAQARGAQLGQYGLYVTATADRGEDMRRLRHDVEQLGAGSSIVLRQMNLQHDVGFVTTLGVGQLPWSKQSVTKLLD